MAEEKVLTPLKAIRKYCLGCSDGSPNEVRLCPVTNCELYMYRFGHNPNDSRRGKSKPMPWMRNNATEQVKIGEETEEGDADEEVVE